MPSPITPQQFVAIWRENQLKERTLTNLYNQRPIWLDLARKKFNAAVAASYGWPADLNDEEILAQLLALNLERAGRNTAAFFAR
jgi:hypothetical protein